MVMASLVIFLLFLTGVALLSPLAAFVLVLLMSVGYLWLPKPTVVHVHVEETPGELMGAEAAVAPAEIEELKDESEMPEVVRLPPVAANLEVGKPVMEDDEWVDPKQMDQQRESEWLEHSSLSVKDTQRADAVLQRNARRETLWSHTGRWSEEDKQRYEIGRRRVEARIASQLRSDGNMVIEDDVENPADGSQVTQDQPYAGIMAGDHTVFHSTHFRNMAHGSGNLAARLRSTI